LPFQANEHEIHLAKQIAWQVGRRWSMVNVEDLRQTLFLWLYEHPAVVERYRNNEHGRQQLALALKREALRVCTKETAARQGRNIERDNFYTEEVVRRALPFLFQAWPETKVEQDPNTGRNLSNPFDSGDALAIMADIKRAFKTLPPQDQMVLELRYQEDLTLADIGKRLALTRQAIDFIVDRSVELMSNYLSR